MDIVSWISSLGGNPISLIGTGTGAAKDFYIICILASFFYLTFIFLHKSKNNFTFFNSLD